MVADPDCSEIKELLLKVETFQGREAPVVLGFLKLVTVNTKLKGVKEFGLGLTAVKDKVDPITVKLLLQCPLQLNALLTKLVSNGTSSCN